MNQADNNDTKEFDLNSDQLTIAIREAGLEKSFNKFLQSHTDAAITKAIQTRTGNLDAKKKSLEERMAELEGKINAQNRDSAIKAALAKANLAEDFLKFIHGNQPEEIEAEVKTLKEALDATEQSRINTRLSSGELAPVKSGTAGSTDDSKIDGYIKSQQKTNVKPGFKDGRYVLETETKEGEK